MWQDSCVSIGELGHGVCETPGGPATIRGRPARNASRISALRAGRSCRARSTCPPPRAHATAHSARTASRGRCAGRLIACPPPMPTAPGAASGLLAAERGLDLSLVAGAAWVVPRFTAGGRAPDRFALHGSVNTVSVELCPTTRTLGQWSTSRASTSLPESTNSASLSSTTGCDGCLFNCRRLPEIHDHPDSGRSTDVIAGDSWCPPTASPPGQRNTGVMGSESMIDGQRPSWASRMRAEREARGWSQNDAVRALETQGAKGLPSTPSLLRNWKRWEAGDYEPDDFYKPLIAKAFGTVSAAFFPRPGNRDNDLELLDGTGMNTLELVSRLRVSDVSSATLDALRITTDRLCAEYPHMAPEQLAMEGRAWMQRVCSLLDRRLTLAQHREVLSLAGTIALLVGCVEFDMGDRRNARATRLAALQLGQESENANVTGWAHEMAAWFAITQGDLRGVIAAAEAGEAVAPNRGVTVQLAAQRAKAWARIGDRAEMEHALDRGRTTLETLPYPEDLDHHFVVDPAKFDFYAMDCYRILGDNERASIYADEVIRSSIDFNGTERAPMRITEARLTLGVVAARDGDVEHAVALGRRAISGNRQSLPSLLMVSGELRDVLAARFPSHPESAAYLEELRALASRAG